MGAKLSEVGHIRVSPDTVLLHLQIVLAAAVLVLGRDDAEPGYGRFGQGERVWGSERVLSSFRVLSRSPSVLAPGLAPGVAADPVGHLLLVVVAPPDDGDDVVDVFVSYLQISLLEKVESYRQLNP